MAQMTQFYNAGAWGYMGVGPTPSKGFNLTVSYNQEWWAVPFGWEKMGILFYKIGDTTKYAVHKTAVLNVVDSKIVSSTNTSQTVELTYDADNWDFYGGFTVSDLAGAAICFFTKDPEGITGSAPNGLDYASIETAARYQPIFTYTLIPIRFANKIDGSDIYAKRAECDSDGNPLITTYATKAELAGKQDELTAGTNITIDSDGVISAAGGGETYTAGENITIDSDGVISADLPEEEEVDFEELDLDDYQGKLTEGTGISIDSDGVVSVDSSVATKTYVDDAVRGKQDELTPGTGIDIDSDGNISVDSTIATKTYVGNAVQGKQNALTGITDVQVVQSLPASPVATVLYLIPEV